MILPKLPEALQMSALLIDADNAGYIGLEDTHAVQKMQVDFGSVCQAIALRSLRVSGDPISAKSMIKAELLHLKTEIARNEHTNEETLLFDHLEEHLFSALEREGLKQEWQRQLSRFILFFPTPFRALILVVMAGVLIFAAIEIL